MGFESQNTTNTEIISQLEDIIKVDGQLTRAEKTAFLDAYKNDRESIQSVTQNEQAKLRNFILTDYGSLAERLIGSVGIKEAQQLLGLPDAGEYTPETLRRVIQFQERQKEQDKSVIVDGIIGSQTLALLRKFPQKTESLPENRHVPIQVQEQDKTLVEDIEAILLDNKKVEKAITWIEAKHNPETIQKLCERLGVETGNIEALAQSIARFQSENKLSIDGLPGKNTLKALGVEKVRILLNNAREEKARKFIKKNLSKEEILELKKALGVTPEISLEKLAQEVARHQSSKGLTTDGMPGKNTLRSLGVEKYTMNYREILDANQTLQQAESFEGIESLSERWQIIFSEFFLVLGRKEQQEVLDGKPFTLVDSRSKELIFINGKEQYKMSVILGQNGTTRGGYNKGDRRTPVGKAHEFNKILFSEDRPQSLLRRGEPYIPDLMPADNASWRRLYFDESIQSYRGEKYNHKKQIWEKNKRVTVVGVSIQSDLAMDYGARYFHLVGPNRNATWGCVGIKYEHKEEAKHMARTFQEKGGFGYVSKS